MTNYKPLYGGLQERKAALIKKLQGQNNGAGGAAQLSAGIPFGALPRLGYNPAARSVFNKPENFNFSGSPDRLADAYAAVSGQNATPPNAPLQGVGPSAGSGSGSPGLPQGTDSGPARVPYNPATGEGNWPIGGPPSGGSSYGNEGGTRHLMGRGGSTSSGGASSAPGIPQGVLDILDTQGAFPGGVGAWLQQNPWFLAQLGFGDGSVAASGGGASGGGTGVRGGL